MVLATDGECIPYISCTPPPPVLIVSSRSVGVYDNVTQLDLEGIVSNTSTTAEEKADEIVNTSVRNNWKVDDVLCIVTMVRPYDFVLPAAPPKKKKVPKTPTVDPFAMVSAGFLPFTVPLSVVSCVPSCIHSPPSRPTTAPTNQRSTSLCKTCASAKRTRLAWRQTLRRSHHGGWYPTFWRCSTLPLRASQTHRSLHLAFPSPWTESLSLPPSPPPLTPSPPKQCTCPCCRIHFPDHPTAALYSFPQLHRERRR